MEPTKSGEILFKESDSARVEAIETEPLPLLLSIWKRSQLKCFGHCVPAGLAMRPLWTTLRTSSDSRSIYRRAESATLAQRNFHPASTVVSDGLHCFTGSATPAASTSRSSLDPVARPP